MYKILVLIIATQTISILVSSVVEARRLTISTTSVQSEEPSYSDYESYYSYLTDSSFGKEYINVYESLVEEAEKQEGISATGTWEQRSKSLEDIGILDRKKIHQNMVDASKMLFTLNESKRELGEKTPIYEMSDLSERVRLIERVSLIKQYLLKINNEDIIENSLRTSIIV